MPYPTPVCFPQKVRPPPLPARYSSTVARHLKTTEDLHDSRPSPRTESLVGSAAQWAERIMSEKD
jgi:hypothetical protein